LPLDRALGRAEEKGEGKLSPGGGTVYPASISETERHQVETETYHYLGWSHHRVEQTVERLMGGPSSDAGVTKSAAREVVAAFGIAGPPESFWQTQVGHHCTEAGFGRR
jgi:hypothetical protein